MVSSASLVRPSGGSAPSADASEPHLGRGRMPAAVSWEQEPAWKRGDIPFSQGSAGKCCTWTVAAAPRVYTSVSFSMDFCYLLYPPLCHLSLQLLAGV